MGNNQQGSLSNQDQLLKIFTIHEKDDFNKLTFLNHRQTNKQYILREHITNMPFEHSEVIYRIKQRQNISNAALTNLAKMQTKKDDDLCTTYYKTYSLWQYPRLTLADQINHRALTRQPFTASELLVLLRQVSQGLCALQQNSIGHQCLTTRSILLDNPLSLPLQQPIAAKVLDPLAYPLQPNIELIYHKRNLKNIYLSPSQCEMIERQNIHERKFQAYRQDVFVLGMIMVQCTSLQRQDDCYLDDCSRINWNRIQQRLAEIGEQYGVVVRNTLAWMLRKDTSQRPDWFELAGQLNQYQQNTRVGSVVPQNLNRNSLNPNHKHLNNGPRRQSNSPARNKQGGQIHNISPGRLRHSIKVNQQPPYRQVVSNTGQPLRISFGPHTPQYRNQPFFQSQFVQPTGSNLYRSTYVTNQTINRPVGVAGTQVFRSSIVTPQTSGKPQVTAIKNLIFPQNEGTSPQKDQVKQINSASKQKQISTQGFKARPFIDRSFVANVDQKSPINQRFHDRIESTPPKINFMLRPVVVQQGNRPVSELSQLSRGQRIKSQLVQSNSKPNKQTTNQGGYCVEQYPQGRRYEGFKLNGKKEGQGRFFLNNKLCFEGFWHNDLMQGRGKLYYQSGKLAYQGFFYENKFHGEGKLYNEKPETLKTPFIYQNFDDIEQYWTVYQGQFMNDMKEGRGRLILSNGQVFQGTFLADSFQGQGRFQTMEGRRVHGLWQNNRMVQLLS